jgi:UDP-N-acetylenolpyruvoylglucosamine reductase
LETESNLIEVTVYDLEKSEIIKFKKEEINFSYRNSIFKETEKYFIIKASFDLSALKEKYSSDVDNIKFREEIQPK